MTIKDYAFKSPAHARIYQGSTPEVALKKFLNYLRLHTQERPKRVRIIDLNNVVVYEASVEWYKGKLRDGTFEGAEGLWWKIIELKLQARIKHPIVEISLVPKEVSS